MTNSLVIVESPAKAKTISKYLGAGYVVESSIGHIRDLPRSAAEVPKSLKDEPWARLGIDVENDFKPHYVVSSDKKKQVKKLKDLLANADELYLATDEDREGEAIAWHLLEVLNPRVPVKRMVFHEITKPAIEAAVESPRELDRRLVDAQETRRMLDRLYGYEVSPVLWKKVMPQLSAGRVQSVAVRIVVERERERMDFVSANYWGLVGRFTPSGSGDSTSSGNGFGESSSDSSDGEFKASLVMVGGSRVAVSRDFGSNGQLTRDDAVLLTEPAARSLAQDLQDADFSVLARTSKPYRRRPAAPFITSTLQQEAARKLNMTSAAAMRTAQSLYEKGHITYMRTDSTSLSAAAVTAARSEIADRFGAEALPSQPRAYSSRVKNAQEAHEAIRPSGDKFTDPAVLAGQLSPAEAQLYELVWQRTLASQMTDCTGETVQLRLGATSSTGSDVEFAASGTVIKHLGYREVYTEGRDAGDAADDAADAAERRLPPLQTGDAAECRSLEPNGSDTKPPARYTEASLVRRLEELGVGRPSTYASIMGTIIDRGYVWKKGSALVPSFTAFSVVNLLERHFPKLVDYAFTAEMEDQLDQIAAGEAEQIPWLRKFYFGDNDEDGDPGLKAKVTDRLPDIDARLVNSIPLGADDDGVVVEARVGRYGPLVQRGEDIVSVPEGTAPDELTIERALELLTEGSRDGQELGKDPVTGLTVTAKTGRYGPYVQLGSADEVPDKPKSASLLASMSLDTVTLEQALQLLSLPRSVGHDPDGGEEITVQNGRYGPYVRKGSDTRSLSSEEQLFTITLQECLELLAQPKTRGRAAAAAPLRELGVDPASDRAVVVKDGRYGHYVTDGEINASLRSGDTVEGITIERASELLAERRAKGPAKKRSTRRKPARKSS